MPQRRPTPRRRRRRGCLPLRFLLCLLVLTLILGVVFHSQVQRQYQEWRYPLAYEDIIRHYSDLRELDPYLVMAVIRAESSFIADAQSPVGALGLMQLMPDTAQWIAERIGLNFPEIDLFHPRYNIRMGTYYLRMLIDMFEEVDTALAAYNAGMGNVGRWLNDYRYSADGRTLHTIPFTETRNYVERVNDFWEVYRELYELD